MKHYTAVVRLLLAGPSSYDAEATLRDMLDQRCTDVILDYAVEDGPRLAPWEGKSLDDTPRQRDPFERNYQFQLNCVLLAQRMATHTSSVIIDVASALAALEVRMTTAWMEGTAPCFEDVLERVAALDWDYDFSDVFVHVNGKGSDAVLRELLESMGCQFLPLPVTTLA